MTFTSIGPVGPAESAGSPFTSRRAVRADRSFRLLALGAGLLVLVVLVLITVSTTREAWPAFSQEGLDFILSDRWAPTENEFGALAFIYGTLIVSAIALVISVPLSLGIALLLTEVAPKRLRQPVVYVLDLLAAVPSVVFGL